MNYSGLGHVALRCAHFDDTLNFYLNGLGLELWNVLRAPDDSWSLTYVKTRFGQFLELFPAPLPPADVDIHGGSYQSFTLVVDDLNATLTQLRSLGVTPLIDRRSDDGKVCICDPEGNQIELIAFNGHGKGISSFTFSCRKYEETLAFYRDTMEMPVMFSANQTDGTPWYCHLKVSETDRLVLFNQPYETNYNDDYAAFRHYCLLIPDMAYTARRLDAKGIELLEGGQRFLADDPEQLQKELSNVDLCGSLSTGVLDPEGVWVELMQYTERSMQIRTKE